MNIDHASSNIIVMAVSYYLKLIYILLIVFHSPDDSSLQLRSKADLFTIRVTETINQLRAPITSACRYSVLKQALQ